MSTETQKVDVLATIDCHISDLHSEKAAAVTASYVKACDDCIERAVLARAAVADLIKVSARAIPFLRDEAGKYDDDGSNEPLETLRDLEAALARIGGAA